MMYARVLHEMEPATLRKFLSFMNVVLVSNNLDSQYVIYFLPLQRRMFIKKRYQ